VQRSTAHHPWFGVLLFVLLVESVISIPLWLAVIDGGMSVRTALILLGVIFVAMYVIMAVGNWHWMCLSDEERANTVVKYIPTFCRRRQP
jgi:FtsH-binding integral membrane protein